MKVREPKQAGQLGTITEEEEEGLYVVERWGGGGWREEGREADLLFRNLDFSPPSLPPSHPSMPTHAARGRERGV